MNEIMALSLLVSLFLYEQLLLCLCSVPPTSNQSPYPSFPLSSLPLSLSHPSIPPLLLLYRAKNSVKHFPVRWNGQEFTFGFGRFPTVGELVEHFASRPVIGGESGEERGKEGGRGEREGGREGDQEGGERGEKEGGRRGGRVRGEGERGGEGEKEGGRSKPFARYIVHLQCLQTCAASQ